MSTAVYVKDRVVGAINDGIFLKTVYGRKHMLQSPLAWALDADSFDRQILNTCHTIRIQEMESGIIYSVSVSKFNEKKGTLNRGYGRQYFLILSEWIKIASENRQKKFSM